MVGAQRLSQNAPVEIWICFAASRRRYILALLPQIGKFSVIIKL